MALEGDCPIVAAYDYDEPCDVVILAVRVSNDGRITIIGDEENDRGNEHEIDADDIFAGTLISLRRKLSDKNKGTGATGWSSVPLLVAVLRL